MADIGRMLYLAPVVRALIAAEWTRPQARSIVDAVRAKHHPVTVATMERYFQMEGL